MTLVVWFAQYRDEDGHLHRENGAMPDGSCPFDPEPGHTIVQSTLDPATRVWVESPPGFAVAAPVVAPVVVPGMSKLVFLRDRLTFQVVAAALARESTDPFVAAFRFFLDNASSIHVDDTLTIAGVSHLAQIGLISSVDVARILTPPAPGEEG